MFSVSRHRRLVPALAPIVTAALLTACMHWAATTPTPAGTASATKARITLANGATQDVNHPSVQGDSLIGYARDTNNRVAYAVKDIATVHTWRSDPAATAAVLITAIVALVAASIIVCSTGDGCFGNGY